MLGICGAVAQLTGLKEACGVVQLLLISQVSHEKSAVHKNAPLQVTGIWEKHFLSMRDSKTCYDKVIFLVKSVLLCKICHKRSVDLVQKENGAQILVFKI